MSSSPEDPSSILQTAPPLSTTLPDAPDVSNSTGNGSTPPISDLVAPPPALDSIPSTSNLLHSVQEKGSTSKKELKRNGKGKERVQEEELETEDEPNEEINSSESTLENDLADPQAAPSQPPATAEVAEEVQSHPPTPYCSPTPSPTIEDKPSETAETESDEEEISDESDAEFDEEEPSLKYARLGGDTTDILTKDSASALTVSMKYIVMGTHNGVVFVLDFAGKVMKRYRPHTAMINDLSIDTTSEFVASASMDGQVAIQALASSESYIFDLRRPMRCVALEPHFGKRSTRQFVSGGMAGNLILHEKGWLGHKETILHSGEGPIWAAEWKTNLIAWANDAGVRIYDTASQQRITFISRAENSPRADLFKCTLYWQSEEILLIAWADLIKVCLVKEHEKKRSQLAVGTHARNELFVEVTQIFQVDCMISGIAPYRNDSYLILAYSTQEKFDNEATLDPNEQKRKEGLRPELRIISNQGEELSSDAIGLRNFTQFQCRDYSLCPSRAETEQEKFFVISPNDVVVAQPRDEIDHVTWLIEQQEYESALHALEKLKGPAGGIDALEVGKKYLNFLVEEGNYAKAAQVCPKILGFNAKLWEDWIFLFADKGEIKTIIPYVPTHDPQLSRLVYEMILAHFLRHDPEALLRTIKVWPHEIYDVSAVILAVLDQISRQPDSKILIETVSALYLLNRQPGKALPFFLQLARPDVFNLIRDYNLFSEVQNSALELIEFDLKLREKGIDTSLHQVEDEQGLVHSKHGTAIDLLVNHTQDIPIQKVVNQLKTRRKFLYMYLDALFDKDPQLAAEFSDLQVELYAEFDSPKLINFLRASNFYSLEKAYKICDSLDLVPEMVFLLARMGNNKQALNLIIERLQDVERAIEFAKQEKDDDLWEDLLKYSENKPEFIRGLLENVGAEIDPLRLIKRIRNGLQIPGLKPALIKILHDFNLQVSLMEGCKTILYSDCRQLAVALHDRQTNGFLWTGETACKGTGKPIFPQLGGRPVPDSLPLGIHFLSGESFSSVHLFPNLEDDLPNLVSNQNQIVAQELLHAMKGEINENEGFSVMTRGMNSKLRLVADLKSREQIISVKA